MPQKRMENFLFARKSPDSQINRGDTKFYSKNNKVLNYGTCEYFSFVLGLFIQLL